MRAILFSTAINGVHLRIREADTGMAVVRSDPRPDGSIALRTILADQHDRGAVGTALRDEAMAIASTICGRKRDLAQAAVTKAAHAGQVMRPGSAAVRQLMQQGKDAVDAYLADGRALAARCMEIGRELAAAGFLPADGAIPDWLRHLLEEPATA